MFHRPVNPARVEGAETPLANDVPAATKDLPLGRRQLLLGAGLAAAALPWPTSAQSNPSVPRRAGAPRAALPDLDDPAQQLLAYVRMRGSTDGRLVADVTQGLVYALLPTGRPKLLWQSRGFQLSRYRREPDGAWAVHSNYFGTFADARTGEPITAWDNPFTGRRDTLQPTIYGPTDALLFAGRTLVDPTPAQRAAALAEPATRRWTRIGDVVTLIDEMGPPDDPARPPDLDLASISARASDLADASLASVPSQTAFGAVEPWREWMRMEQRPGLLFWHLQIAKVDGLEGVPEVLRRAAEAQRPGFIERALKQP